MGNNSGKRSLSQSTDDSVIRDDENWMKDVDSEANHPNLAPYSVCYFTLLLFSQLCVNLIKKKS